MRVQFRMICVKTVLVRKSGRGEDGLIRVWFQDERNGRELVAEVIAADVADRPVVGEKFEFLVRRTGSF